MGTNPAWDNLWKVPEIVFSGIPYTVGFGVLAFIQAYVQTAIPDVIMESQWPSVILRSLTIGTIDAGKLGYWDDYDTFKK
jgi:hypothetical protein